MVGPMTPPDREALSYSLRECLTYPRLVGWLYRRHRNQSWPQQTWRYRLLMKGFEAIQRFILRFAVTSFLVPPKLGEFLLFHVAFPVARVLGGRRRPPCGLSDPYSPTGQWPIQETST